MNERIRLLSEQAHRSTADELAHLQRVHNRTYDLNESAVIYNEKFAQLIVRKCLRELQYTVLDTQELRRDKSTDYQVGWEDGMFDAGEMIKQHFGVNP
jgi:hypothetical protein